MAGTGGFVHLLAQWAALLQGSPCWQHLSISAEPVRVAGLCQGACIWPYVLSAKHLCGCLCWRQLSHAAPFASTCSRQPGRLQHSLPLVLAP